MNTLNAIIDNAGIDISDSYSKSLRIWLEMRLQGGGMCLFSVICPYTEDYPKNRMGYALNRIFDIVGVEDFDAVIGKPIRAIFQSNAAAGDIVIGIEHFLYDDDNFIPREEKLWKRDLE